ncbi:MAG: YqgE/AlgH family protein [Duodenibacillus sp.]
MAKEKFDPSGMFLVASPDMKDSVFAKTVVFVVGHAEQKGSLGMVVNRPCDVDMAEVLRQVGVGKAPESVEDTLVGWGGPVQRMQGFILHTPVEGREWNVRVYRGERLEVTCSPDLLHEVAQGNGPEKLMIVLGCAAWAPGQLEDEYKAGAWLLAPCDPDIIFSLPLEDRYTAALSLVGVRSEDVELLSRAVAGGIVGHA